MAKRIKLLLIFAILSGLLTLSSFAEIEHDGYVVKFKDEESKKAALELINSSVSLFSGRELEFEEIHDRMNIYKTHDSALIEELEALGLLEFSEPDYICELHTYDYTQDNYFSSQWAHTATNIERAWELGAYGQGATVAVLDSGVLFTHTELKDNLIEGMSFATDTQVSDIHDNVGHGTGVAGVIAAAANGSGVVGAAHRTKVIPIKVTNSSKFSNSVLAKAIMDTVDIYNPDVINMSLGYSITNATTQQLNTHNLITGAINYALNAGTIIVASAGNANSETYYYPASLDGVVSVCGIQRTASGRYIYSSYTHNDKVTIAAPAQNIYTTYNTAENAYVGYSGTSFASPYVAAVAAIAKSIDPDLTPAHFIELLIATANKDILPEGVDYNKYFGHGILNAGALIETLINEKSDGLYFLPPDYRTDGGFTVAAYNAGEVPLNLTFIAKGEFSGKPLGFDVATPALAKGDVHKISLPPSAAASATKIWIYFVNPITFAPWRLPLDY